jgi:hypothetical protein
LVVSSSTGYVVIGHASSCALQCAMNQTVGINAVLKNYCAALTVSDCIADCCSFVRFF